MICNWEINIFDSEKYSQGTPVTTQDENCRQSQHDGSGRLKVAQLQSKIKLQFFRLADLGSDNP